MCCSIPHPASKPVPSLPHLYFWQPLPALLSHPSLPPCQRMHEVRSTNFGTACPTATVLLNWGSIPLNLPSAAPVSLSSPCSEFSNAASNPQRAYCGRSKSHRLRGSMVREEYYMYAHWLQTRKLSIIDRPRRPTSYSYLANTFLILMHLISEVGL